jgi:hypothetical protein
MKSFLWMVTGFCAAAVGLLVWAPHRTRPVEDLAHLWFNFVAAASLSAYSVANSFPAMPFPAGPLSREYPMRGQI